MMFPSIGIALGRKKIFVKNAKFWQVHLRKCAPTNVKQTRTSVKNGFSWSGYGHFFFFWRNSKKIWNIIVFLLCNAGVTILSCIWYVWPSDWGTPFVSSESEVTWNVNWFANLNERNLKNAPWNRLKELILVSFRYWTFSLAAYLTALYALSIK